MADFSVYVDWNDDYDYSDSNEDITADVINVSWRLGMGTPYQLVADEAVATIAVINADGKYNPENSSGALYGLIDIQKRVKIASATQGVMWQGWIDEIQPTWEVQGSSTGKTYATLRCVGLKKLLQDVNVALPLLENVRANEVIARVLRLGKIPPVDERVWLVGVTGRSEIGINTVIGAESDYSSLETGAYTFGYFGDVSNPDKTRDGYRTINDVVQSERGVFFQDRNGKAVFWNRNHLHDDLTVDGTIASNTGTKPRGVALRYGARLANEIEVRFRPRKETTTITLWSLPASLTLAVGQSIIYEALYTDADGLPCGGKNVEIGDNTSSGGTITATIQRDLGDRAEIKLLNADTSAVTLTALTLVGTAVETNDQGIIKVIDQTSISTYGKRGGEKLNLTAIDSYATAKAIADLELERFKTPRNEAESVTLLQAANGTANAKQLEWTVGSRVTVSLPEVGHSRDYHVMGEEHSVSEGLGIHETRLILTPVVFNRLYGVGEYDRDDQLDLRKTGTDYEKLAAPFTPTVSKTLGKVKLYIGVTKTPADTLVAKLYTDSSGAPGSYIANATTNSVDTDDLDTGFQWVDFVFPLPISLTGGTTYWVVLETSETTAEAVNFASWGAVDRARLEALAGWWALDEAPDLDANLNAFWKLNPAGTVGNDEIGSADLTENGTATAVNGLLHRAVDFDGSTTYYSATDAAAISPTGDFTLVAWVRLDSLGTLRGILNKWGAAGNRSFAVWVDASDNINFAVSNDGTASTTVTSSVTLVANKWYCVVAKHDNGTDITITVNGTTDTQAHTTGCYDSTAALEIGRYSSGYWDGIIHDVGLWAREWQDNEIAWAYANQPQLADYQGGAPQDSHSTNLDATRTGYPVRWRTPAGDVAGLRCTSGNYASVADHASLKPTGDFSVGCWVIFHTLGTTDLLLDKKSASAGYRLYYDSSAGAFIFNAHNGASDVTATAVMRFAPAIETPYFVMGYHDDANDLIGVRVSRPEGHYHTSAALTGSVAANTEPLTIGEASATGEYTVSRAFFWGRLIDATEFNWLWNNGNGRNYSDFVGEGGLALSYASAAWSARYKDLIFEAHLPGEADTYTSILDANGDEWLDANGDLIVVGI